MAASRGLRNRNPGNIRKSLTRYEGEVVPSKDKAFKQFCSMAYGYRAMFVLLDYYSRICYVTLRQMISRYAPPVENYTEQYITFVATTAEVNPDARLPTRDRKTMTAVVAAMSQMENGIPAELDDVDEGWKLFEQEINAK